MNNYQHFILNLLTCTHKIIVLIDIPLDQAYIRRIM